MDVFNILRVGLITRAALDTEMNTKDTTTSQIQPPQLQLLLDDLHRKLEHALPATANKKKMFLKVRQKIITHSIYSKLKCIDKFIGALILVSEYCTRETFYCTIFFRFFNIKLVKSFSFFFFCSCLVENCMGKFSGTLFWIK